MNARGINLFGKFPKVVLLRECECQGLKGEIRQVSGQRLAKGLRKVGVERVDRGVIEPAEDFLAGKGLACVPAAEGIVIVACQHGEIAAGEFCLYHDRSRKAAQQRGNRLAGETRKHELLNRVRQHQCVLVLFCAVALQSGLQFGFNRVAFGIEKCEDDRNLQRGLALARGIGIVLAHPKPILTCCRVKTARDLQLRRTGLFIPAAKLGEVYITGRLHCPDEVVGGDCLAVVLRKVVSAAFEKTFGSHQQAQHPDDFSPLDVNRQGVEVVDLNKRVGADGMRHWPRVLAELLGANQIGILNPLDAGRVMIGAELLLTKDGKTFLEAELKPVA